MKIKSKIICTGFGMALLHQWVDSILPEERERVFAVFATLMGTVPEVSVEYRSSGWHSPLGPRPGLSSPGCGTGPLVRLTGIASDITKRKLRTSQNARESRIRLRLLNSAVLQTREAVLITDARLDLPGPRIGFVNPAFTEMQQATLWKR